MVVIAGIGSRYPGAVEAGVPSPWVPSECSRWRNGRTRPGVDSPPAGSVIGSV